MPKAMSGSDNSSKPSRSELFERFIPILLVISIALAFVVGMLWQKVSYLEKGGTVAGAQQQAQPSQAPTASLEQIKDLYNQDLIKFGDPDRKITFVEVADPSCPYCHIAGGENPELNKQAGAQYQLSTDGGTYVAPVPEMRKLLDSGQASYIYIYSPGHGNGEMGMRALYCGYEMGKFWEVHDLLMNNAGYDEQNTTIQNDTTKSGELADFLSSAVDPVQMKACLDSGKYDGRLTSDAQVASSLGVGGTPGFYVNDVLFGGAYSWDEMKSAVDAALQ